jgi:hypothetical protein
MRKIRPRYTMEPSETRKSVCRVLYSGKFLLVQNFTELHISPSEEIFMVLIFVPSPCRDHTHASRLHV